MKKQDEKIIQLAKTLRKNMTKEERRLWYDYLSTYPIRFYRQRPIGRYIVDFYCAKAKLVIELDGSQHFSEDGLAYDKERSAFLENSGIEIIRFTNVEIKQKFSSVCEYIDSIVEKKANARRPFR